jgi:hypothetical protein
MIVYVWRAHLVRVPFDLDGVRESGWQAVKALIKDLEKLEEPLFGQRLSIKSELNED